MIVLKDFPMDTAQLAEELGAAGFEGCSVLHTNRQFDEGGRLVLDENGRPVRGEHWVGITLIEDEVANEQKVRRIAGAHTLQPPESEALP